MGLDVPETEAIAKAQSERRTASFRRVDALLKPKASQGELTKERSPTSNLFWDVGGTGPSPA
jgi:hypothetical protein